MPKRDPKARKTTRRKKAAAGSVGLSAPETRQVEASGLKDLRAQVEKDGGAVLGSYRDPFGGADVLLVALPLDMVEPTPYQRDPSDAHVKRLMTVIEKVGRFLDPVVLVRQDEAYWTPNGNHRLQAMRKLGAKLDDAVSKVVSALKAKGLTSPYLKPFVVARINPIRFSKPTEFDFDEILDKMIASASKFNVDRVKQEDVAKMGSAAPHED